MDRVIIGIVVFCIAVATVVLVGVMVLAFSDGEVCPEGQSYQVVAYTNQLVGKVNTVQPVYACK
jgi:hypothetical protein